MDTSALNRLAAAGVVFDQHFADVPEPTTARRTWRTGHHFFPGEPVPPGDFDLLAELRRAGVKCYLITTTAFPDDDPFLQGWDEIERVTSDTRLAVEPVIEAAREALDGLALEDNWLLWIDLGSLLPPWQLPDDFLDIYFDPPIPETSEEEGEEVEEEFEEPELLFEDDAEAEEQEPFEPLPDPVPGFVDPDDDQLFLRVQTTYAAAVTYADAALGVLFEAFEELKLGERTLVVVTSDRGLSLGEHGLIGPVRPWLHDEVVRLPLVLRLPGGAQAGRRVGALTQTPDLPATLLDFFGLPAHPMHGTSLLPLTRGEPVTTRSYLCAGLQAGEAREWTVRLPAWAFLIPEAASADDPPRGRQLYAKPEDRWEVNDLAQHHPDLCERLEQTLRDYLAALRRPGPWQAPPLREEPVPESPANEGDAR
jgi:hypothetical protein